MSNVATHRLIDASAALGPAERALLNLWIHRGLDDPALARMTGMSLDSLAGRRRRIIESLSEELGLPPDQIHQALTEIAASSAEEHATAAASNGALPRPQAAGPELEGAPDAEAAPAEAHADAAPVEAPAEAEPAEAPAAAGPAEAPAEAAPDGPSRNGHVPGTGPDELGNAVSGTAIRLEAPPSSPAEPSPAAAAETPSPPPDPDAEPQPGSSRRRGAWILAAVAALVALAVVLLIALRSDGGGHRHRHAVATHSSTVPTPPPSPSSPSPSPTVSRPPTQPLAALPGGLNRASGSVQLIGKIRRDLKLRLSVKGLPSPLGGDYEVWLYNSILDSQPLTRLRGGGHAFTITLPGNAHHFHWIDVSFQPTGIINHSGESVLRSPNPAAVSKARLKKRSSRRRHRLKRATTGSNAASKSK